MAKDIKLDLSALSAPITDDEVKALDLSTLSAPITEDEIAAVSKPATEIEDLDLNKLKDVDLQKFEQGAEEYDDLGSAALGALEGPTMGHSGELGSSILSLAQSVPLVRDIPGIADPSEQATRKLREQGFTVKGKDEAKTGLAGLLDRYRQNRDIYESELKARREEDPYIMGGAEIISGLAVPGVAAGKGAKAAYRTMKAAGVHPAKIAGSLAAKTIGQGMLGGAASASGYSEADLASGKSEELQKYLDDLKSGATVGGAIAGGILGVQGGVTAAKGVSNIPFLRETGSRIKKAFNLGRAGKEVSEEALLKETQKEATGLIGDLDKKYKDYLSLKGEAADLAEGETYNIQERLTPLMQEFQETTPPGIVKAQTAKENFKNVLEQITGTDTQKVNTALKLSNSGDDAATIAGKLSTEFGEEISEFEARRLVNRAKTGKYVKVPYDLENMKLPQLNELQDEINRYTGVGGAAPEIKSELVQQMSKKMAVAVRDAFNEASDSVLSSVTNMADERQKSTALQYIDRLLFGKDKVISSAIKSEERLAKLEALLPKNTEGAKNTKRLVGRLLDKVDPELSAQFKKASESLETFSDLVGESKSALASRTGALRQVAPTAAAAGRGAVNTKHFLRGFAGMDDGKLQQIAENLISSGSEQFGNALKRVIKSPAASRNALLYGLASTPAFRQMILERNDEFNIDFGAEDEE